MNLRSVPREPGNQETRKPPQGLQYSRVPTYYLGRYRLVSSRAPRALLGSRGHHAWHGMAWHGTSRATRCYFRPSTRVEPPWHIAGKSDDRRHGFMDSWIPGFPQLASVSRSPTPRFTSNFQLPRLQFDNFTAPPPPRISQGFGRRPQGYCMKAANSSFAWCFAAHFFRTCHASMVQYEVV